ncbi:response regulator [Falsiroseomonas oryzae]|uniref:response regulator n=1 Tax=Falsiroseomonas oryzae TaxID=2766473 RepID=UPI0022EB4546|nr:response regulator [Roseomonas sp. MO-31]
MTGARDPEVESAQVHAVYGQIPAAVAVSAINAVLLAFAVDSGVPHPATLGWLASMLAIAGIRTATWWAHRRSRPAVEDVARWARIATGCAALAGLGWGGGAALLWPDSEAAQLFWVFVVGGMCAGAVALHYAHLPIVIAFILPAGLPIAARFALAGPGRGPVAAAMILVFLAALAAAAHRSNAQFRAFARLRRDLRRQAGELEAARARLRQEVKDHGATAASLHQAQKMEALGQLTGGIAHDFNNLLMVVLGSLALLRKRLPAGDAQATRLLDNAVAGANRGAVLTQRLLAFGRRQALRPAIVDLAALLDGMADLLRRSIGPGHRLVFRMPKDLAPVFVDPNQLELAILNLVLNARDAMPEGGEIGIAGREEAMGATADGLLPGRYVVLGVTDHGIGMDAATLARATEPFFTTKGVGKGTGLGLPMAYGLAAQSGGRLLLHSQPGEGTVAELWLPRSTEPLVAPAPAGGPAPGRPARRFRVLLVDDDPLVLASTAAILEDMGHGVVEAESGARALACLQEGAAVDVVVTDYGMPGMSGTALAEQLRRLRPGLPVIVVTGYGELPAGGPVGLASLRKPFDEVSLGAALETAVTGTGPRGPE